MSASVPGNSVAGRVVVTARAIEAVFSALAAEELGGTARGARVRVRDDGGLLSVAVRAPVHATGPGSTVLERVASARQRILTTGAELTGATLSDVTIRVTDITSESEKRAQ